ncbi:MAG: hypothetical protein M1840_004729 [Geoglossum simile]|nr:MAG: hypothetical protein M1840_004729 [Geoglossum simile]
MAPIRRYLRISKYSILECRIYLENPGLADTWLLNARDPVLPRVFESVRPLVLPKLREENERAKGKGKKASRGIKDVVVQDDFEVSVFLTDVSTRHSLLTKQKFFHEAGGTAPIPSSVPPSSTNNSPPAIGLGAATPVIIREENSDLDAIDLESILPAPSPQESEAYDTREGLHSQTRRSYARHKGKRDIEDLELDDAAAEYTSERDVHQKRKRPNPEPAATAEDVGGTGDDKKLSLRMSYDGFSIYGRILCLVIKRRPGVKFRGGLAIDGAGQAMEDWIVSTQNQHEVDAN